MAHLELEGGIARVFLGRPEKANALDSGALDRLIFSLQAAGAEPGLRAVVLGGQGRAFCGGADVAELASLDGANAGAFVERIHLACRAIRELPVPVIARLHGAAIGAGLEIAAACDLRIAAEGTRFAMPEVRLGIPSVVEAALLPRLIGAGRAAWLVLTGEAIDAARALQWGLVEEVCDAAQLDAAVERLLKSLLAGDREALRQQKQLLQHWDELPLAESVSRSIGLFSAAYSGGRPNALLAALRR
ncbi:MAG TPA: enoyl-CoA hydratase-related protein [Burkholderiales bacterium]|nr:enoyl-CoA hydratase-related protein [Burkholderiales bacterium]